VSKQTVDARIQAGRHNVFHPGTPSPVIAVEPIHSLTICTSSNWLEPAHHGSSRQT
jgi:hypothetical protein